MALSNNPGDAESDNTLDAIFQEIRSINARLDRQEERFAQYDQRFTQYDQKFEKVDERIEKMIERGDRLSERLQGLAVAVVLAAAAAVIFRPLIEYLLQIHGLCELENREKRGGDVKIIW